MRTIAVLVLLLSSFLRGADAQKSEKVVITGTVLDSDKEPIPGAIIMINGKRTRTITNSNGNYSIRVFPSDTLIGIFTFGNGFYEESIKGRTVIDFNFETAVKDIELRSSGIKIKEGLDVAPGEEAVDVGYGFLKKKDLTIDISFIDGTKLKNKSYPTVCDMIVREATGVRRYFSGTHEYLIIQGASNLFGKVPPLIIIDGMFGGKLEDVSPIEVKTISILKGTAAAIYGSRGYGGVILIRTKTYDQ